MSKRLNKNLLFLVTGTTRGLGKAIAQRVLELDYELIEINKSPTKRKKSFIADLSKPNEVVKIIKYISELIISNYDKFIVIFISNASTIDPIRTIGLFKDNEIVSITSINFISPIIISNAIAKLKNKSILLNITSGAADTNNEGLSLYSATKAGMNRFISITGKETNNKDLYLYSFDPGTMDTDMQSSLRKPSKYFKHTNDHKRLKRDGELNPPEVVANKIIHYVEELLFIKNFKD